MNFSQIVGRVSCDVAMQLRLEFIGIVVNANTAQRIDTFYSAPGKPQIA